MHLPGERDRVHVPVINYEFTRLYPAGQGSANRRYCHVMRKATSGNVVGTSQTGHPFAGHFQAADTIITIGTFLQRFSKKSVRKCSETGPAMFQP